MEGAEATELERLRSALARAEGERDEALAAVQAAPPAPAPGVLALEAPPEKSLEDLEAELTRAQAALAEALREAAPEGVDPCRLRELALLSEQVGAKRRRT